VRVLDAGCGPGNITIGLAAAVGPSGEVVGIDKDRAAVEAPISAAAESTCTNATFEVADVYRLPFADETFDAVFCHALLQHLAEPPAALRELRRVVRPGGLIGAADADHGGSIMWPELPVIDQFWELVREMRMRRGGGDTRIGRRLSALLHEVGFERVVASATADSDGDGESSRRTAAFWANYLRSPELREQVLEAGLATAGDLDEMADAWLRWGGSPGAFWARFWCQAVGWAPEG
jgi:SAM-dependent methyltransferase